MSATVEFWQRTWRFYGTLVAISTGSASLAELTFEFFLHHNADVSTAPHEPRKAFVG